jgi:hypothetical protein
MRARTATAALIKQHHTVNRGIKIAPHCRAAATPRPAVQHQNRDAVRVATLLYKHPMALACVNHALVKGLYRRVKILDCALLA